MPGIILTDKERKYLSDTDFLFTKRNIQKKIIALFNETQKSLRNEIKTGDYSIASKIMKQNPKISRGENYKGLPYVVLDYPRLFDTNDTFSFRVIFWWGNFFSFSLHLEGNSLRKGIIELEKKWDYLKTRGINVCTASTPWQYHFKASNYIQSNELGFSDVRELTRKYTFLKIGRKVALEEWPDIVEQAKYNFGLFTFVTGFNSLESELKR